VFAAKGGQSAFNRWLAQSNQKAKAMAELLK